MKFNKSIVASFVGAALTSISVSAVANNMTLSQVLSTQNIASPLSNANAQTQLPTASGMRNQYDRQTGKATFQWASVNQVKPDLGAIAAEHRVAYAADFYLNQLVGLSTNKNNAIKPVLANIHDSGRGAAIAKYKQSVAGVEIFNREYNVMMDRELNLVASSGYFGPTTSSTLDVQLLSQSFGEPVSAISKAFADLGGNANEIQISEKESADNGYVKFSVNNQPAGKSLLGQPRAKKVFFESKGKLQAAYYVEIETSIEDSVESDYYSYVISADSGKVLFKHNLASHAEDFNYRIYADQETKKPWDGPHGNVIPAVSADTPDATAYLPAPLISLTSGPISTNDAWLADDATTTDGNNVKAYVDAVAPDGFTTGDIIADVTSANTFDYSYDTSLTENSIHNRKAATVNLFYLNNYLHDDFYDHGFDEASGNAQNVNYGRGGVEGDAINAEVQDNSGFSNANMSTPADGASPRMQMYLFDSKDAKNGTDYGVTITSHDDIGLIDITQRSSFGQGQFNVTGDIVRIDDATDTVTDGCEAADNSAELAGKIAIIDRGACAFTDKVKNAQDAGAIAVLIANNTNDGTPAPMGGSDDTVTIPNMGINFETAAAIYDKLDAAETVSISMFNNKPYKGSSWDNGIVAHEWGHYISNRLIGNASGLSNQQGRSMGEGWGDFHALLLLSEADDALIAGNEMFGTAYSATSYVADFHTGIRNYPYSTNMDINPLTFANVMLGNGTSADENGNAEVHDAGEPWAAMLWDSYVALINDDRYSFAEARSLMKDYLVAAYKMTPIAPTYTEARDALLAAAYANDMEDYKLILNAFARRGMGLGAVAPARYDAKHSGVVESYETELSTFSVSAHQIDSNYEGLMTGYCSNDNILDKGETGTVSFTIGNKGSTALSGLVGKVVVTSGQDVTFANDGMITFDDVDLFASTTSSPLEFTLNEAATADQLTLEVTFPELDDGITAESYGLTINVNMDFKDRAPVLNTTTDNAETVATLHDWTENVMTGGDLAKGTVSLDSTYAGLFPVDEQYIFINNNQFTSDVAFETKTFNVGYAGNFTVSWWQYFEIEENWDGGVVEVSVNGSDWADVTTMGGTFMGAGYTGTIEEQDIQPLSNKQAFTGNMPFPGGMEGVDFGTALNGNEVKFRFRMASDTNTSAFGWFIDNVTVTNIQTSIFSDIVAGDTFACDNRVPVVKAVSEESQSVDEGASVSLTIEASDPNSDDLTYSWTQTSGASVALTGGDTASVSFSAPDVASGSEELTFMANVSDGVDTTSQKFTVTVNDIPAPFKPAKAYSTGGSTSLLALFLLPLALLRRRK
ncbi:rhombosortase-dependent M36 family metallopeptidase [Thalassotalea piscium]